MVEYILMVISLKNNFFHDYVTLNAVKGMIGYNEKTIFNLCR